MICSSIDLIDVSGICSSTKLFVDNDICSSVDLSALLGAPSSTALLYFKSRQYHTLTHSCQFPFNIRFTS